MIYMKNLILWGFYFDFIIVRVGDDYYLVILIFEWYLGVCIYYFVDLVNWVLVVWLLVSFELLDMCGNFDSCGVWVFCFLYYNEWFYLVFINICCF